MQDLMICQICKHENKCDKYGNCICSKCGQKYEYCEEMRIILTDSQVAILEQNPSTSEQHHNVWLQSKSIIANALSEWGVQNVGGYAAALLSRLAEAGILTEKIS